jgi:hypothetical protein
MREDIKIITRQCKEAGIFPSKHYINIINYIEENDSYVFYGFDGGSYSRMGVEYEIKFLKLQFDVLKSLIDNDLLDAKDYILVMSDTLQRYDLKKARRYSWSEECEMVVARTNKKEFVEYFFNAFEKNVGTLDEIRKNLILEGLPRD